MEKILFLLLVVLLTATSYSQQKYWQQEANFNIHVTLNDQDHSLQGFESIEYINHSPDTLHFIWFHIWPNAYKNDRTAFSDQLLKNGRTDFYFSSSEDKGYINQLNFRVNGSAAVYENSNKNIDVIKLLLPVPLAPENKAIITTPFHVKLPKYFSRSGYVGSDYAVTQWFPKPAVYDNNGWHPMPYLEQGEFYSEFGKFEVSITAPSSYVIAATGILQDEKTLQEIKKNGKHTIESATKTWSFTQNNIHDFAWFASKDFVVKYDTIMLPSTKIVDVFSYYKSVNKAWDKSIAYIKNGIKKYSSWLGDYPYTVASVVQGNYNETSAGMEYPAITLITTPEEGKELDATIAHEVGHNWFYGALASNERTHPWMDEGMNSFYAKRYEDEKYGNAQENKKPKNKKGIADEEELLFNTYAGIKKDQPIETSSENLSMVNYDLSIYYKAPLWLKQLEHELGRNVFDSCMKLYYSQWEFKHPQPLDFKASMQQSSNKNLNELFSKLYTKGLLVPEKTKTAKLSLLYNLHETGKYNYINISPAVGYNNYDKVMVGGLIHNYSLPLNKFHFIAGALYATGSKKVNGFGRASFNVYKQAWHLEASTSFINFTQNDFKPANNPQLYLGVKRFAPAVKLTLFDKDATAGKHFTFLLKSFFINEDELRFTTIRTPTDTFERASTVASNRLINRLSISMSDARVLYPYNITLSADQGKQFLRAGLTAKYFFNFADGVSGMSARFFAGKFFYLTSKTFNTQFANDRYFLNMTGPKGNEDYTYSDYFIGRNEFEKWQSQQMMERDGFFKVNTDLLGEKVGKTDDWLTSLNLVTDVPDNINPLRVLPFKVPLKVFADIGTYAEAWKDNPATGRFVYDAGIQFSIFRSIINIYVPVLYSKVYKDYYKSTISQNRFLKTISFNIDLSQLQAKKVFPLFPL